MRANGNDLKQESKNIFVVHLTRFDRFISKYFLYGGAQILAKIAAISMVLLTLSTFVTVVGRRSPWSGAWLVGGLELSELLMALISIYAAAYCWYLDGHLRISLIRDLASAKIRNLLDILSSFLFAMWIGAIAWGMWLMAIQYIRTGAKGWSIGIPIGPFMAAFFVAAALFFLVLLRDFLSEVMKLIVYLIKKNKSGEI
jgi:TRAP-type C4-dicarboxylate transport system permease small subunit